MSAQEIGMMPISDLCFDYKNPRLTEFGLTENSTEEEIIRVLWEAMDVRELVMSIAASGFFQHEPLIIAQENSKSIVIEGNRRLAAVRVILKEGLARDLGYDVPEVSEEIKASLSELPVIQRSREEAWRYLGFKHVNGPAKWGSYAKSRYIADVHRNFGIPLADVARQIGDTHKTVQRLYRGLMVIEQAEKTNVFDRLDRWRPHFAFSHLYTGLDYDGISSFLSLRPETEETDEPVPQDNIEKLRELCVWMYGSKKAKTPPVIVSQNPDLRHLDAVLRNREAISALRDGVALFEAFGISRPASTVFEEALIGAKRHLLKARAMLSTGYDESDELLRIAGTVANVADDLYKEMERKRHPERTRRLTEEN